jgi:hypothetical protein
MTSKQWIHPSWVAGIALCCAIGCGDSAGGPDGGGPPGGSSACKVTLSGAQSGTYDCTIVSAWVAAQDITGVGLTVGQGSEVQLAGTVQYDKKGRTGTFASSDPDASGSVAWGSGLNRYVASVGSGANMGSYTLRLSKVSSLGSSSSGEAYAVEGTLDASLDPIPGSSGSGTINLHATF